MHEHQSQGPSSHSAPLVASSRQGVATPMLRRRRCVSQGAIRSRVCTLRFFHIFLLDPAAALGRCLPWRSCNVLLLSRCLLLDVSSVVCTQWHLPPFPSMFASPSCLVVCLLVVAPPAVRFCFSPGTAPRACSCLPAHVVHVSATVGLLCRRGVVANAHPGLP